MTTRLDIAVKALREIAAHDPHIAVYRCSCWKRAEQALADIAAAPPEIVLTREEAELCVQAMAVANGDFRCLSDTDLIGVCTLRARLSEALYRWRQADMEAKETE